MVFSLTLTLRGIDAFSKTVNEGAAGTQNIAGKTSKIVDQVNEVQNQMHVCKESARKLKNTVLKFNV